jgi:hypothetical protein
MSKSKKSKKSKTPKKLEHQESFDIGWDAEQVMADTICAKIDENDEEALDTAFISAFQSLTLRMAHIWNREFIFEIVDDIVSDVENEHGEHVCNDCKAEAQKGLSDEDKSKLH